MAENALDSQNINPTPTTGTKRLFSNRESRRSISGDYGENHNAEVAEGGVHSEKRHRSSDWPLSNASPVQHRPSHSHTSTPSKDRRDKRPSKFVEGSMNDRVSQVPPGPYLDAEALRDRYEREEAARGRKMARPRRFMHHSDNSLAGNSDSSRQSSIFRFGRTIAASFNPSNWKIWSKSPQEEEETPQERVLRERQEKAERIYQELKKSGHFRDAGPPMFPGPAEKRATPSKHDSGVSFPPDSEMTREEKRMGRVYVEAPRRYSRSRSPDSSLAGSNTSARRRWTNRPSLSNVRKGYASDNGSEYDLRKQPRRIPSRKDLQKQQKLVKRVSDLEGKLENARRQLSEALGEPLPVQPQPRVGRSRFVPGALSTLPSERLLSGYVASDDEEEGFGNEGLAPSESLSQIGRALTTEHEDGNLMAMEGVINSCELEEDALAAQINKPLPITPKTFKTPPGKKSTKSEPTLKPTSALEHHPEQDYDEVPAVSAAEPDSDYNDDPNGAETKVESALSITSTAELEATRKPARNGSRKSVPKIRKGKTFFERAGDRSGTYRPARSEVSVATTASGVKKVKVTPKKGRVAASKLQKSGLAKETLKSSPKSSPPKSSPAKSSPAKSSPAKTSPSKPSSVQEDAPTTPVAEQESGSPQKARYRTTPIPNKSASASTAGKQTMKLAKSTSVKKPRASTKESIEEEGLAYVKPSKKAAAKQMEPMYSAIPSTEGAVPPMPKLPKAVRLPSGEVINTAAHVASTASQAVGIRMAGGEPEKKKIDTNMMREDSFEWDKDVF